LPGKKIVYLSNYKPNAAYIFTCSYLLRRHKLPRVNFSLTKIKNEMKKYILTILVLSCCTMACNPKDETKASTTATSTVALPYQPSYSTDFNNNVSDSDLLVVLNSYKYWESGDLKALRSTMGDSMYADMSDGVKLGGSADSVMKSWTTYRDSLSSISINMVAWTKNHSVKDSANYVNVWYKETDTFKNGRVDSGNYEDDNLVKNGKIAWLSSHKQKLK
jgi:hypothetical protein